MENLINQKSCFIAQDIFPPVFPSSSSSSSLFRRRFTFSFPPQPYLASLRFSLVFFFANLFRLIRNVKWKLINHFTFNHFTRMNTIDRTHGWLCHRTLDAADTIPFHTIPFHTIYTEILLLKRHLGYVSLNA